MNKATRTRPAPTIAQLHSLERTMQQAKQRITAERARDARNACVRRVCIEEASNKVFISVTYSGKFMRSSGMPYLITVQYEDGHVMSDSQETVRGALKSACRFAGASGNPLQISYWNEKLQAVTE